MDVIIYRSHHKGGVEVNSIENNIEPRNQQTISLSGVWTSDYRKFGFKGYAQIPFLQIDFSVAHNFFVSDHNLMKSGDSIEDDLEFGPLVGEDENDQNAMNFDENEFQFPDRKNIICAT